MSDSVKVKYPEDYGPDNTGITVGEDENGVYVELNWRPPPPDPPTRPPPPPLRVHPKKGNVEVGPADPDPGWNISIGSAANKATWITISILENCTVRFTFWFFLGGRAQLYRHEIRSTSSARQRQKRKLKKWLEKVGRLAVVSRDTESVRTARFHAKLTAPGEVTAHVTFGGSEPFDSKALLRFDDDDEGEFEIQDGDDLDVAGTRETEGEEASREGEGGEPISRTGAAAAKSSKKTHGAKEA